MVAKTFTNLLVWRKSHTLALDIYKVVNTFPGVEQYGLSSQMKRASVSVGSNIAEGFARQSKKEKIQFYFVALGSVTELQSQLFLARDLSYIDKEECISLLEKASIVAKMLNSLISRIKQNNN